MSPDIFHWYFRFNNRLGRRDLGIFAEQDNAHTEYGMEKRKSAGLTPFKLGISGPYALLDQLQTWLVVSTFPCGACISQDSSLSFQCGTYLTRADLIVVVAAVIIGLLGEVVVVGQGDTAIITLVIAVDEPGHARVSTNQFPKPKYRGPLTLMNGHLEGWNTLLTYRTGSYLQCLCSTKKSCSRTYRGMPGCH